MPRRRQSGERDTRHFAAASGFTLIELLVALAALALLAVLSWRGLDGMSRAQEITAQHADGVLALQTGLAQWSADLDAIVQMPQITALDWNGRVLRMTRKGTATPTDGVHVVGWTRRGGQWLRWQSPALYTRGDVEAAWQQADLWAGNPSDEQRRLEVAVAPLTDWQIFYYRADAWTNPQSSAAEGTVAQNPPGTPVIPAPAANTSGLPDGVRLVLDLPPGGALAGIITRDWVNPVVGGGKS
ncbi:PulJ/GspJ family protein [Ramlibacter sp.]|uniref:PulJ/GspJ family protein n=1 Tax=Ramlibacter sp. TaxID=1917967 RepID=UPI002D7FF618|nr:prepilin-type N-terminal cleavage/methylation domain-containing protein [Ramlibacter sp.]